MQVESEPYRKARDLVNSGECIYELSPQELIGQLLEAQKGTLAVQLLADNTEEMGKK